MTHALHAWADEAQLATIEHEGCDDRWSLSYAEPWVADAQAYPLSPALPLARRMKLPAAEVSLLHTPRPWPASASRSLCSASRTSWPARPTG